MSGEVVGTGVDIIEIERFKKLDLSRDARFLNRIYTKRELDYCFQKNNAAQHLAVRFAAKEAVVKALSGVWPQRLMEYKDIEVVRTKQGRPLIKLLVKDGGHLKVLISLSHSERQAIAFSTVIL